MCKKMTTQGMLIGLMFIGLYASGCGTAGPIAPRSHFESFSPDQINEISVYHSDEYRIQADDVLMVTFSFMDDLTQDNVIVLPDGSVNLIGVGRLELAGFNLTQADSVVTQAYSHDYREPGISIVVRETVGRKVYVLGEVQKPGVYSLPRGGADVFGAVAVAGGFTPNAAKNGAVLVRISEEGYLVQELDLSGIADVQNIDIAMVRLKPYDLIYVPGSRIGDFGHFSRSVLNGLVSLTRIASDLRYITGNGSQRF